MNKTNHLYVEVLTPISTVGLRVDAAYVEALVANTAPTAPAISGGRVNAAFVEVLCCYTDAPPVRVNNFYIEVLKPVNDPKVENPETPAGGIHGWGYVS